MTREAVFVSTARTPLVKSHRGEFNITDGPTLASFAVRAAVDRAGIDPAMIEDLILGCGYPEGTTGRNVARQAVVAGKRYRFTPLVLELQFLQRVTHQHRCVRVNGLPQRAGQTNARSQNGWHDTICRRGRGATGPRRRACTPSESALLS
jgi:hypothetical protein